jgi:hypothetical protein
LQETFQELMLGNRVNYGQQPEIPPPEEGITNEVTDGSPNPTGL